MVVLINPVTIKASPIMLAARVPTSMEKTNLLTKTPLIKKATVLAMTPSQDRNTAPITAVLINPVMTITALRLLLLPGMTVGSLAC